MFFNFFKNKILITVFLISTGFCASFAHAKEDETVALMRLEPCKDERLGISILCNPDWELEEYEDTMLIIISSDPAVTLTIAKINESVNFLEELNMEYLKEIGQYMDGFQIEKVTVNKEKAIMVKAFSQQYPDIRLLDYYFLHDKALYGVLFSVNPREDWDKYKTLLKKIAESFKFVDKPSAP